MPSIYLLIRIHDLFRWMLENGLNLVQVYKDQEPESPIGKYKDGNFSTVCRGLPALG